MIFNSKIFLYLAPLIFLSACVEQTSDHEILFSENSPFGLTEVVKFKESNALEVILDKDIGISQSTIMEGDETYLSEYHKLATASLCFAKKLDDILLLGVGGGEFFSYLANYFPDMRVDAIEINPAMVNVVKKFRHIPNQTHKKFITEDGFKFIEETKNKYDLIFYDIYLTAPNMLSQYKDFFKNVKNHLSEGGVLLINAFIDDMPRAVIREMFSNFQNVAVSNFAEIQGNIIFICQNDKTKTENALETIAAKMQKKYNFRYSLEEILSRFESVKPNEKEKWINKFPVLE